MPIHKWATTLVELVEVLRALFVRQGRTVDQAGTDARDVVVELAHHFGGREFYLPRGQRLLTAIRDAEIYRRAIGTNTQALANEYKLTSRQIRQIVQRQHGLAQASRRTSPGEST